MGVYLRRDSPTWWMSRQIAGQRVRMNTGVTDHKVAKGLFAAWQVETERTRWLGPPPPELDHTIQELITEYLEKITPRKAEDSQRRDRGVLARLGEEWGPLGLGELRPMLLDEYIADRLEDVTFATVSKELGILKSAYRYAMRWGWTTQTPFAGIPLDQSGEERIRWLTDPEETGLLAACSPWLQDLVVVGLDTGLRRGNLVGLQREWVHDHGTRLVIPRPRVKGKKRLLSIPLTTRAAAIIQRRLAESDSAPLFLQPDGQPYRRDQVTMAIGRAAEAAGLTDVCLYTLRHTFISRLVQAGRPLPEVAELAGHRDIRMTMRYTHLSKQHLVDAIKSIERPPCIQKNEEIRIDSIGLEKLC